MEPSCTLLSWYALAIELPAIEIFTRSRKATALRRNIRKTRFQRTWLVSGFVIFAPEGGEWQSTGLDAAPLAAIFEFHSLTTFRLLSVPGKSASIAPPQSCFLLVAA